MLARIFLYGFSPQNQGWFPCSKIKFPIPSVRSLCKKSCVSRFCHKKHPAVSVHFPVAPSVCRQHPPLCRYIAFQVLRRVAGNDFTMIHNNNLFPDIGSRLRIESDSRFIQKHYFRIMNQPLPISARRFIPPDRLPAMAFFQSVSSARPRAT